MLIMSNVIICNSRHIAPNNSSCVTLPFQPRSFRPKIEIIDDLPETTNQSPKQAFSQSQSTSSIDQSQSSSSKETLQSANLLAGLDVISESKVAKTLEIDADGPKTVEEEEELSKELTKEEKILRLAASAGSTTHYKAPNPYYDPDLEGLD